MKASDDRGVRTVEMISCRPDQVDICRAYEDGFAVGYDDALLGCNLGEHNISLPTGLGEIYDSSYSLGYLCGFDVGSNIVAGRNAKACRVTESYADRSPANNYSIA